MDSSIGVYVIDRFTYYTLEFLEGVSPNSKKTIYELVGSKIKSNYFITINFNLFLNLSLTAVLNTSVFQLLAIEQTYFHVI
jgi:glycosylphosphatidylinositol transamidase (GPIT) subunit GPI8